MKYICVQNTGEADVKDMTLLGLSTSRGSSQQIGQFGTGFIQGVLVCLRNGITPVVYIGEQRIAFHIEGDKDEVVFRFNRKKYRLNVCIGFGEVDWKDPRMGLREFISNAIDADGWTPSMVQVTSAMKGKAGTTRIFVPHSPFADYVKNLGQFFLHVRGLEREHVISKDEPSVCRIYRKGVLVCELSRESLFDYNLGEDAEIDECRNMNEYTAMGSAMRALRKITDHDQIRNVFRAVLKPRPCFELEKVDSTWIAWSDAWGHVWQADYGETPVCPPAISEFLKRKQIHCLVAGSTGWHAAIVGSMGAVDGTKKLMRAERDGHEVLPASQAALCTVDRIWSKLERFAFTNGRNKPQVACFRSLMNEDGSDTHGLYSDGVVMLREDQDQNEYVALHECIHHITGADDETYAFSEACLRLAHAVMKRDEGFRYECKNTLTIGQEE